MPIHFNDLDVVSEVVGLSSALIVPCYMCPAVTVAVREKKPFIRFFRNFLKSAPFEQYIATLQSRLEDHGVKTKVFRSIPSHEWFMCMWTSGKRKRLQKCAEQYDAVIVLGCDSATETVRDVVKSAGCKVIEGMEVTGIMNAQIRFYLPGNISFENCKTIPISQKKQKESALR
ncbi:MAG: hypothetical protein KZQ93_20220 [Candidatus Thiodiazotropha sp. (ex Monitilora ramsayi)]|nr:hypothetical protein [Candidatus Thiodiazotropha sp. (ex Monitilora ramsayi)]